MFRICWPECAAESRWLPVVLSFVPAVVWAQQAGQVVAEDRDTGAGDPPAIETLHEYARALVEQSDWPIEFEDLIIITSGAGGYQLNFRTSFEAEREEGVTPEEEAYIRLTYEERVGHWQAMVCSPKLLERVEQEAFTAVLLDSANRRSLWSGSYACGAEAN